MPYPSLTSNAISLLSDITCKLCNWFCCTLVVSNSRYCIWCCFTWYCLPLWAINQVQYILLSCVTHGSSNVPLLIVIGCAYMELLLQSEWELHWPEWSLDAISCAWIRPPRTCWFASTLSFHLEVWSTLHSLQTRAVIYRRGFRASVYTFLTFTLLEHGNLCKY